MTRITNSEHDIFTFAYCGSRQFFESKQLADLAELAEKEKWTSPSSKHKNDILYYYIVKTFEIIHKEGLIVYSDDHQLALFNTGLMTPNGDDIYGSFIPNNKPESSQKWYFFGFKSESDRYLSKFNFAKPEVVKYDDDLEAYHFDSRAEIVFNSDHILDDHWDDDTRFPESILKMPKALAIAAIKQAFDVTKKKLLRNPRLAVPQYYNGMIMFLLPISIETTEEPVMMALAIEKTNNGAYRANTIFALESAYKKARLIMKPESNWLMSL